MAQFVQGGQIVGGGSGQVDLGAGVRQLLGTLLQDRQTRNALNEQIRQYDKDLEQVQATRALGTIETQLDALAGEVGRQNIAKTPGGESLLRAWGRAYKKVSGDETADEDTLVRYYIDNPSAVSATKATINEAVVKGFSMRWGAPPPQASEQQLGEVIQSLINPNKIAGVETKKEASATAAFKPPLLPPKTVTTPLGYVPAPVGVTPSPATSAPLSVSTVKTMQKPVEGYNLNELQAYRAGLKDPAEIAKVDQLIATARADPEAAMAPAPATATPAPAAAPSLDSALREALIKQFPAKKDVIQRTSLDVLIKNNPNTWDVVQKAAPPAAGQTVPTVSGATPIATTAVAQPTNKNDQQTAAAKASARLYPLRPSADEGGTLDRASALEGALRPQGESYYADLSGARVPENDPLVQALRARTGPGAIINNLSPQEASLVLPEGAATVLSERAQKINVLALGQGSFEGEKGREVQQQIATARNALERDLTAMTLGGKEPVNEADKALLQGLQTAEGVIKSVEGGAEELSKAGTNPAKRLKAYKDFVTKALNPKDKKNYNPEYAAAIRMRQLWWKRQTNQALSDVDAAYVFSGTATPAAGADQNLYTKYLDDLRAAVR